MDSSEEKEKAEQQLSGAKLTYKIHNSQIIGYFRTLLPDRTPAAPAQNCMKIPTGIGAVHFEWWQHRVEGEMMLDVAIHFETSDKRKNQEYCSRLKRSEQVLTAAVGEQPQFELEWGAKWASVYIRRSCELWTDEIAKWAAEKMVAFIGAVEPLLQDMKKSVTAGS